MAVKDCENVYVFDYILGKVVKTIPTTDKVLNLKGVQSSYETPVQSRYEKPF